MWHDSSPPLSVAARPMAMATLLSLMRTEEKDRSWQHTTWRRDSVPSLPLRRVVMATLSSIMRRGETYREHSLRCVTLGCVTWLSALCRRVVWSRRDCRHSCAEGKKTIPGIRPLGDGTASPLCSRVVWSWRRRSMCHPVRLPLFGQVTCLLTLSRSYTRIHTHKKAIIIIHTHIHTHTDI